VSPISRSCPLSLIWERVGVRVGMSIYDAYIPKLADYVTDLRAKSRQIREFRCPSDVGQLLEGLPVRVGPGASQGIILRGDTFAEIGNPEAGSAAFLLWTDNPALVNDGKITLIGPDIPESPDASLPFGQVLIVAGSGLTEKDHQTLEHAQFVADRIEGYMIRSVAQLIWSRVHKEVASRGFCFETLGRALVSIFKTDVPKVQAMEILFVTSGKDDLEPLGTMGAQVNKIFKSMLREDWKARGFDVYECASGYDCKSCPDQPVCDDIKEVIKVRKKKGNGSGPDQDS
jgi:CO dehydrogenase/acetyl-CoA synthase beta subunit